MKRYETLIKNIKKEIKKGSITRVLELLYELPHFDWVGIYLLKEKSLVLDRYKGFPTIHKRIPLGKGLCGTAALKQKTIISNDVSKEKNYIPCDENVKSEIVVPIKKNDKILGVIDVDSNQLSAFNDADKKLLEKIAKMISDAFDQLFSS
ncbi:putative GAF sensor protein [Methanothermus fervidus DSM 2088]|uniref:Putative GAF sensor protein n=1 Tax=Methanothermus fervidus (strain ATCC 43054 / DSM 2088 / JCM 10308 / V24 S) TaxID=523846 RepID=E3GY46_METFV|nr:GAF domain-containing protein [Methanothermus fervidus]ADP77228.1 putative GAF sensor protein [Methanothermus fervidus DSM 2088]